MYFWPQIYLFMRKFLLIVFNVFVLNSQNHDKLDSYSNKFFESNSFKEKLDYANLYMNLAKKENKKIFTAIGYYLFVNLYKETNVNKTLYFYDKVIENSKYQNHPAFPMVAYCEKAEFLYGVDRLKESMDTYNSGLSYCREVKNEYEYVIQLSIAITKSEELGEIDEALKIYKKCFGNFKQNQKFPYYYLKSIFSIADAYKTLKFSDSASYYNRLGYKEAVKFESNTFKALFVLNEGANLINKRKFKVSLDSINKVKASVFKLSSKTLNPLACHFYSGKAYQGLGKFENALFEYKKVDSFYMVNKRITPEFFEGYTFIINYYHNKGDLKNELKYLKKYNLLEKKFSKKYKNLYKSIKEKYEIPQLIRKKENENFILKSFVYIICPIMSLSIMYIVYIKIKIARSKRLFEELLRNKISNFYPLLLESGQRIEPEIVKSEVFESYRTLKSSEINSNVVEMILNKLIEFEKNKGFLDKSITSKSLAQLFDTNSKYISNVINDYKKFTVNNYINNLRIEYAILILQKDSKKRKYNIESLADEFGFNSSKSFNVAFYNKTGIKPTYFIKELQKKENVSV
jgi:AraC-like DNA-binding protein